MRIKIPGAFNCRSKHPQYEIFCDLKKGHNGPHQYGSSNNYVEWPKHGGPRPGAGRPATLNAPVRITVTLEQTQADWLAAQDKAASEIIRELIRKEMSDEPTN